MLRLLVEVSVEDRWLTAVLSKAWLGSGTGSRDGGDRRGIHAAVRLRG
jgi:hypothetical protein